MNCLCFSLISYFLSLHKVLGTATSPYDRRTTTRNIPKALEAAMRMGMSYARLSSDLKMR